MQRIVHAALVLALAMGMAAPALADDDRPADERAWLGVQLQDLTADLREGMSLGDARGVLVSQVEEGSPAASPGLLPGDVVQSIDGRAVESSRELATRVRVREVGESVKVVVLRDGKQHTFEAKLEAMPRSLRTGRAPRAFSFSPTSPPGRVHAFELGAMGPRLGVRVEDLSPELGAYFKTPDGKGALVLETFEDTPARRAGLLPGDVILAVEKEKVEDGSSLREALSGHRAGDEVTVRIRREGKEREVKVTLDDRPERRDLSWFSPDAMPRGFGHQAPFPHRGDRDEMDALRRELDALRDEVKDLRESVR